MMSAFSSGFSSNCFMNSLAPEKATWLMYFLTSSAVMPMPVSEMVLVFCSLSTATFTFISSSLSGCSMRNLVIASQALLTASRRNISLSEYSQRLMTGIIFWASIDTEPFCFLIAIVYIPLIASEFGAFLLRKRILAPRPSICKKKLALSP